MCQVHTFVRHAVADVKRSLSERGRNPMGPDNPDSPIVFQFAVRTRVRFGAGCRFQLPEVLAQEGWHSLGLVVDHNLVDLPMVRQMLDDLEQACERVIVAECRVSSPVL